LPACIATSNETRVPERVIVLAPNDEAYPIRGLAPLVKADRRFPRRGLPTVCWRLIAATVSSARRRCGRKTQGGALNRLTDDLALCSLNSERVRQRGLPDLEQFLGEFQQITFRQLNCDCAKC
jgi:hypothetical protein